ncbi:OLC1v1034064C1 [Oldenlandia corymbosa var. corymbosa]|uniref:OLC1v1034064C1 n=1 Tax=Oldenlandia corymbosa var. corymbosa TaxID=529605 RepID=A0AAV1CQG7_OLDCO|nr:OLC1v1034064C1 [Oldenlandia corymbosa var. corymbosa]
MDGEVWGGRCAPFREAELRPPSFIGQNGGWPRGAEGRSELQIHGNEETGRWNKEVFGSIFKRKRRALARIGGIQRAKERYVTPKLLALETEIMEELEELKVQEEILLI